MPGTDMAGDAIPLRCDRSFAGRVRDFFLSSGFFDEQGIRERLGGMDVGRITQKSVPRLLALTAGGSALDMLIRLFVLRVRAGEEAVRHVFGPQDFNRWMESGLLTNAGGEVEAPVRIKPFAGLLLVSDPSDGPLRFDHVLGPGKASVELLHVTPRIPFKRALDLGTGCGVQGLLCARHCATVTGTDINPRALAVAEFNARLNGVENMAFRTGSLFEPVADEPFDLILMNMPYAISPDVRFLFRDGGGAGDGFLQNLIRQIPDHLATGGFCMLTAQWAELEGEPWRARLLNWFRGLPFDVWIFRQQSQPAASYAENWIAETELPAPPARWQEWNAHLHALRIKSVHTGLIVLRRRQTGEGWFSITDDVTSFAEGSADDILAGFRQRDFLATHRDDGALLGHTYRLSPKTRISQTFDPAAPGWRVIKTVLRNRAGLSFAAKIDEHALTLLQRLDGAKTLRETVEQFAADTRFNPAQLAQRVVAMVRTLIEHGFLLPAE